MKPPIRAGDPAIAAARLGVKPSASERVRSGAADSAGAERRGGGGAVGAAGTRAAGGEGVNPLRGRGRAPPAACRVRGPRGRGPGLRGGAVAAGGGGGGT